MELKTILKRKSLVKTGAIYSISSTLSAVAAMIVGFANMRWLGPELLGIWQSLTIINSYLPFLQLGIQSGLNIELPILLGEEKTDKAMAYVATAKKFATILSLVIALLGVGAVGVLLFKETDVKVTVGAIAVVGLAIISCYQLHLIATYRSASAFDKLSKIYLVDACVTLVLLFFIYKYQYYGLVFYHVAKEGIKVFLMWYFAPYRKVKQHFDKSIFVALLKRGVVLMGLNQIGSVIGSLPKLVLLSLGGVVQVGLFSPALAVHSLMSMIPSQIIQFLQPQMGYKYGQTKRASYMRPYFNKLTLFVPLLTLPFAIIGIWLIEPVLVYIFPKYLESLTAIRIMFIGFLFSSSNMTRNFLITIKAYIPLLILLALDLLFFSLIPIAVIKMNVYSMMTSMAIGLSISYFVSYMINYFVVIATIKKPKYNIG